MQEFFARKKEIHAQEEKKQPPAHKPLTLSMSEGLMFSEGKKIEAAGRASFEKSVKVELSAMKARAEKRKARRKRAKKRRESKKRRE